LASNKILRASAARVITSRIMAVLTIHGISSSRNIKKKGMLLVSLHHHKFVARS
jgi:hypothetical protein